MTLKSEQENMSEQQSLAVVFMSDQNGYHLVAVYTAFR